MGETTNLEKESLQQFINAIKQRAININKDKVFKLDQIVEAHTYMESNQAKGKIVVVV